MNSATKAALTGTYLEFYASCPEGFESALDAELQRIGLRKTRRLKGRVTFTGTLRDAYRACLWSRLASRVFVVLGRFDCWDANALYDGVYRIPWEQILIDRASIAVTARGTNRELRNTHYAALCVKDAICDRLADEVGARADVDTEHPDARIALSIRDDRASIHLDLSGEPLFKRLPREATRPGARAHVLRPDYAALLLEKAGWLDAVREGQASDAGTAAAAVTAAANAAGTATAAAVIAAANAANAAGTATAAAVTAAANAANAATATTAAGAVTAAANAATAAAASVAPVLLDLCCAGGGLELEALNMLQDRAPGLLRARWGFEGWRRHDVEAWNELLDEADERAASARDRKAVLVATDVDPQARSYAERVLKHAGFGGRVAFPPATADRLSDALAQRAALPPLVTNGYADTDGGSKLPGTCIVVADSTEVPSTQAAALLSLTARMREGARFSNLAILSRDSLLAHSLGVAPAARIDVKPNNEDATIFLFDGADLKDADAANGTERTVDLGDGRVVPVLAAGSDQFAARLKKVARLRRKWAQRAGVSCYRVYDADLPDYAAAIDLYQGAPETPGRWLVIAEYAAPKSIDPAVAQARFLDILTLAPMILDVAPECVHAKARTRSRGGSQYANAGRSSFSQGVRNGAAPEAGIERRLPLIQEGGLTFAVNFDDYLDTGIFLDHRVTRDLVRQHARGCRRFLNLFAYTGTATCYAADGGAEETVTVDLSNTYLAWAERNMRQNGFAGSRHEFVRADVRRWIAEQRLTRNRWDLIFCDPPTFSNSAKMGSRTFDVQRDHAELIIGLSRLLTREGEAIFSCNLRTFKPDLEKLARAGVILTDITAETIPEDFARNPRIHKCYLVKRYPIEEALERTGFGRRA